MPKKYSEQFKMQVAYDYFVDRCPVNALCDKYNLTVHTVRYFYKNRRGEYRLPKRRISRRSHAEIQYLYAMAFKAG